MGTGRVLINIMPVIAIVSEYNPFHNGHLYQIQKIKEMFPESAVVSIMSGSLVQRGEIALFSKYNRAEIAVRNGVDAVFELPSVYSNSPANIFAYSAVYIMQKLGGIDYICFGSESGDLALLDFAAEKIMSGGFESKLREKIKSGKNNSYPTNVYNLFCELYGEEKAIVLNGSNNILAIEYLKALKKLNSTIKPLTIKRIGADFNAHDYDGFAVSASYIRGYIRRSIFVGDGVPDVPNIKTNVKSDLRDVEDAVPYIKNFMPETAYKIASELIKNGKFTDMSNISPAIISHLNRLDVEEIAQIAEVCGGEEHRIKKVLRGCFDYNSLVKNSEAKHITSSSIRRVILNIFFGITKETQNNPPDFTSVLALNEKGKCFLNGIRKTAEINIVTKPADIKNSKTFEKNLFIDNTCKLALFNKDSEINEIKQKPYVSKSE